MTGPLVLGTPDYLDVRWPANVTILKQMAELGLKKTLFGSVNFFNTKLVERAGALLEGAYMSVSWAPVFPDPASKKLVDAYQRLYNELPEGVDTTDQDGHGLPVRSQRAGVLVTDTIRTRAGVRLGSSPVVPDE